MLGFADAFIGNPDEAEEVVQIIFVNIWEKRGHLDPEKNIAAYLFRSVKNKILNRLRDLRRHCDLSEIPAESYMDQQDMLQRMCFKERKLQVMDRIGKMPEVQQKVFMLSKVEGMSNKEIACKLKLSVRTIEHHLYLGRKFFNSKNFDKSIYLILICFNISL